MNSEDFLKELEKYLNEMYVPEELRREVYFKLCITRFAFPGKWNQKRKLAAQAIMKRVRPDE